MEHPHRLKAKRSRHGQALVEYVLIVVLVSLAIIAILTATGPALGNVFSNTVYNLLNTTQIPYKTLDANDFWRYVTAVASYTPMTQNPVTNTPMNPTAPSPAPSSTPITFTPTNTSTATSSPTNGPSPTPTDASFVARPGAGFSDSSDSVRDLWHAPFQDAWAKLPWKVDYYNGAVWNGSNGSLVSGAGTPFTGDVMYAWNGTAPASGVNVNGFGAIFSNSNTTTRVPFEARRYQVTLIVGSTDGARFKIDGASVVSVDPCNNGSSCKATASAQVAAGPHDISVEYAAGATGNHSLQLVFSILADSNDAGSNFANQCAWNRYSPGHSPSLSWWDSAGNYSVNSACNLRLRGKIDISQLTNPRMVIFDHWQLGPNTHTDVGVRDYFSNNDWTWVTLHTAGQTNLNWQREFFDLKSFGGVNFLTGSRTIEIAFRIVNTDTNMAGPAADGWHIDDIAVEEDTINNYTLPASDDMDGNVVGNLQWLPECSWAVSNEQAHNGTRSWSDSPVGPSNPAGLYNPNSDCSLDTNGVIDLTSYGGANPAIPQLLFWNKYFLGGTTSTISVEAAPITNRTAWQALTPQGGTNPYIAQGTGSAPWTQETFNLTALGGNKWFFRFRLVTDGGTPSDGWYVDEVIFRERPLNFVGLPFYEPFESITNWALSGNWNLTNGGSPPHRSGGTALTDSPTGNYIIPSVGSANTAELITQIDLNGSTAPKLEFWTYWATAPTVNLYLEMSRDGGLTWPSNQILWKHLYNDPGYPGNYNTNLAWTRYTVDLSAYACPSGCPYISLRYRLESPAGSTPADGMYIDDLRIFDDTNPYTLGSNPFSDDMEAQTPVVGNSTANWLAGGAWQLQGTTVHAGTKAWSSNPNLNYVVPEDSILELAPTLDLTGVVNPILSFWNKYAVNSQSHYVLVEISVNGGTTWTTLPWIATTSQPIVTTQTGFNLGWTRQQMNLSSYVSGANKKIRLRFRLNALTTDTPNQGWWMDDFYVGSLGAANNHLTFYEDFSTLNSWTTEGNWQTVPDYGAWHFDFPVDNFTPVADTYGGNLLNNQWNVDYYHYYQGQPFYPAGRPAASSVCQVNVGGQISGYTQVGSGTVNYSGSGGALMTWSDGSPNATQGGSNTDNSIKIGGGLNRGFRFTVAADRSIRVLKVYAGTRGATVQMTATLSDGSAAPVFDATSLTDSSTSATTNGVYTLTYAANSNGQTLTVTLTEIADNNGASGEWVQLQAAALSLNNPVGAPQLAAAYAAPVGTIDLTAQGTLDWGYWGYAAVGDHDTKACARAVMNQAAGAINYSWGLGNAPAGGNGNAQWITDENDYEQFYAVFTRKMIVNAGTYRFWIMADDGVSLLVDGVKVNPKYGGTSLPYPWLSTDNNDYAYHAPSDYFYDVTIGSTQQHTFEIDYFQGTGNAIIRVQVAERSNLLHSGLANQPYLPNQDTAAYLNSSISIPASATLKTTISYYERYSVGSSAANSDPLYVKTSTDGGFTWTIADVKTQRRDSYGNPQVDGLGNPILDSVPFTFNADDQTNNVRPGVTYQNWQLHTIDMGTSATARILNIKFELDSRVSSAQADGWYIDEITVTQ